MRVTYELSENIEGVEIKSSFSISRPFEQDQESGIDTRGLFSECQGQMDQAHQALLVALQKRLLEDLMQQLDEANAPHELREATTGERHETLRR